MVRYMAYPAMHASAGGNLARASTTDGLGAHAICTSQTKAFRPHQIQHHHHLSESACATISNNDARCVAHVSNFANSIQCSKASPHGRDDPLEDATIVRMLEHARYEAAALMPDCPTKGNPARHMPTRLLAVSSRKRYCLVTGPRYCESPLCLERLLYAPSQSQPTPYHLNSMRASLNAN